MEFDKVNLNIHIKKVDELYPNISEEDIIERLAYMELDDGMKTLKITDRNITTDLLKLSDEIISITSEYMQVDIMFNLIIGDYNDLLRTRKELCNNKFRNKKLLDDLNRYFLHFLASARLFTEFMENYYMKKYGNKTDEYLKYKKIVSGVYDSYFSYRLFYYLRNFSQHIGLPITHVDSKLINPEEHSNNSASLEAKIDIKYLLDSSFSWKNIKNDLINLQNKDKYLDAYNLCEDFYEAVTSIKYKLKKLFLENNNHIMQDLAEQSVRLGLVNTLYFTSKITKHNLKYNPSNYIINPIGTKVDVDLVYIDLAKLGIVNLIQSNPK